MSAQILKVRADSKPKSVAGAIAGAIREVGKCELHCIGAGSLNAGVKAIAVARGYCSPEGKDLICIPGFMEITMEDQAERTGLRLIVEPR